MEKIEIIDMYTALLDTYGNLNNASKHMIGIITAPGLAQYREGNVGKLQTFISVFGAMNKYRKTNKKKLISFKRIVGYNLD